jgi:hypothetical protein
MKVLDEAVVERSYSELAIMLTMAARAALELAGLFTGLRSRDERTQNVSSNRMRWRDDRRSAA